MTEHKKASVQDYLAELGKRPGQQQRFGAFTPLFGYPVMLSFAIVLFPFFLYMLFFNWAYFGIRNQKPIPLKDYLHFDRHNIAHLTFIDKVWCEYCEWANGTIQWTQAILNEVERRYCPIQNKDHPHCDKAKAWRSQFLQYEHPPEELAKYYRDKYLKDHPNS